MIKFSERLPTATLLKLVVT